MTERLALRDRVGGRHAFSWRVWLVVVLVGAPFLLLIDQNGSFTATSLRNLAIATIATAAVLGALFAIVRGARPPERSLPLLVSVAVALAAAISRVVLGPLVLRALGEDVSVVERLVGTALPVAILILALNAGVEALAHLREQRAQLLAALVELEQRKLQQQALTEAMTNALLTNVLTATADLRQRVGDVAPGDSAADRLDIASALRTTAVGSLRDLSHELHRTGASPGLRTPSLLRTFLTALRTNPLWPRETAFVSALIASFGAALVSVQTAQSGAIGDAITTLALVVAWAASQFALVWVGLQGIVALGERWRVPGLVRLTLAIFFTAAISVARTAFTLSLLQDSAGMSLVLTSGATALLVVLGTTFAMATQQSRETLIETLRTTVDASETEAIARNHELVRANRTLARYVHGTLQSRLLASALAIEQAERDGDPAAFDAALEQARAALSLPDAFVAPTDDLTTALQQVAELWDGFAVVTVDLPAPIPHPPAETVLDLCRIVEEAVANAMRHGDATAITIAVTTADDGALEVVVTDDGAGPGGGRAGLGTALFDLVGPWTLASRDDGPGAVLTVRVAQQALTLSPQPD